jgi:uncharacterized protein YndB with AHSA1/START domain
MTIAVSGEIHGPIERIWGVLRDFGGLSRWHPTVVSCSLREADGYLFRRIRVGDQIVEERLDFIDEPAHRLAYSVTAAEPPSILLGLAGKISLTALADGRTRIDWSAGLDPTSAHAAEVDRMMAPYYQTRIEHLRQAVAAMP